MKKSIFILLVIISIFISSCVPQVTVTSAERVTVTLPTATQSHEPSATPTAVYTPTPAQETIDIGGNLSGVLGEKVDGGTLIESFVADPSLTPEQQADILTQFDETRLGLEGDWVKTADGRVVLLDDLSDLTSVLAEYKIFKQTGKMQVVVDGSTLTISDEAGLLKVGLLWDAENGLPVEIDEARESTWKMHQDNVLPIIKEMGIYASTVSGDLFNSDRSKQLIVRYTVFDSYNAPSKEATEQSNSGMINFQTLSGVVTVFVENFILTPEK